MKKNHWQLILEPNMKAQKSGVYLFAIRNDNHISYECRKLNEGESFYSAVDAPSTNPSDWYVPIAYHFCNEYVSLKDLSKAQLVTEDSWYPFHSDIETYGVRVLAFTLNGVLTYAKSDVCVSSFKMGYFRYNEDDLDFEFDYEMDNQQDIKLLAYHYVENFGEDGHTYWWNVYRKIHP